MAFSPRVDDDVLLAREQPLQVFTDVRRDHFLRLLVVFVQECVCPHVLDKVLPGQDAQAVETEAIDEANAGALEDLNTFILLTFSYEQRVDG